MGASAKRKKEKQKDFQKPQLKVGKAKPRASNFTDTSFKAKSIVVGKQALSVNAPSAHAQFVHHASLLRNRSDSQRLESLAFLFNSISSSSLHEPLPEPFAVLLQRLFPLILDGSNAVRQQLIKVLSALAGRKSEIHAHVERALLYVHAGMSHLSSSIRVFAVEVLDWLITCAGAETVACAGGWRKTLDCFLGILGWSPPNDASIPANSSVGRWSTTPRSSNQTGDDARSRSKVLTTLTKFLRNGMAFEVASEVASEGGSAQNSFPIRQLQSHRIPASSNAFAHLNLFGPARQIENEIMDAREDRQRLFKAVYHESVLRGLENNMKEGGELGRVASGAKRAVLDGLQDFEADSDDPP